MIPMILCAGCRAAGKQGNTGEVLCYINGFMRKRVAGRRQPDSCPLKGKPCGDCSFGTGSFSDEPVYCNLNGEYYDDATNIPADCPLKPKVPEVPMFSSTHLYWRTKEGLVMKITDLKDSHLLNCISMVERQNPIYELWLEAPPDMPELDQIAASLSDWEEEDHPVTMNAKLKKVKTPNSDLIGFRQYIELINEAKKRGLQ